MMRRSRETDDQTVIIPGMKQERSPKTKKEEIKTGTTYQT